MMIDPKQFRLLIVRPVLDRLGLWSLNAENLVMGTVAQESKFKYSRQLNGGPALGLCQMEPKTHNSIWDHYLSSRKELAQSILSFTIYNSKPDPEEMVSNHMYAVAMCRVHYLPKPGAIPDLVQGLASYWKQHYNTPFGKGTVDEFIHNYSLIA